MAITIYKFAYHVDWNTSGIARSGGRAGASLECDLSNYYTKTNLITPGEALIDSRNIFWAIIFGVSASNGIATVSGRLVRDGLIRGSSGSVSGVGGELRQFYVPIILGFQIAAFANPLNIDCTTYKDWICTVTGDTTINLNNTTDGDAGMLELIIELDSSEATCTITLGTMWTKRMGPLTLVTDDGADNIISWRKVQTSNVVYTIAQIE